ncbi:MAG: protein-glutamate O-methyltransferase [Armatimonadetes bacterium]|nr:protein-glutamate O-methyltransferase [Armatimonadota bacterium]
MTIEERKMDQSGIAPHNMSDIELKKFVELIYNQCGISLNSAKKSMLSARFGKRLRALGISSYKEYYDFVTQTLGKNDELIQMIDAVTTNTTHFFREANHFSYLTEHALPNLPNSGTLLRVWSAGCSTGEEPYTLAMVLSEHYENHHGNFSILATDVSSSVLQKAKQAVYDDEMALKVPALIKRKYMMQGKGAQAGNWRVIPELRKKIKFGKLNFMDNVYGIEGKFDIIFCRNVIIYFDLETKVKLINYFHKYLDPGGYLFIGHSETLNGLNDDFKAVAPTVYRKPDGQEQIARRRAA